MTVVHLHAHTHYSFGRGTASPAALCSAAARQGAEAVALTDLNGLYGAPEFAAAAEQHGLQAIYGVALPDPSVPRSLAAGRAVVLARDADGYRELCQLISRRLAAPHMPLNRLLETASEHLWLMTPDYSLLKALHRTRGARFLLAELRAGAAWERLCEEASELGVGSVATAAVQLAGASERRFQRLLVALHREIRFPRVVAADLAPERAWVLDEGAMRASFTRNPDAVARAVDVARDCRVELADVVAPADGRAAAEATARLRLQVVEIAEQRFGRPLPDAVGLRLERELRTLCRGTRPGVLRLVADLAAHARSHGIPVWADAPAAGSLVAWCLDLTAASPLDAGAAFARLCNDQAGGVLQLDLRVPAASRPRLIDQLRRELGDARVARPGRILRWSLREALRDVARSAALPAPEAERVLRQLPTSWRGEGPDELVARHPQLQGAGMDIAPWDRVLKAASRLAGVPQRLEIADGAVIAPGPVGDCVPLQPVDGRPVTQWDPAAAADAGLLVLKLPADELAALELRARRGSAPTVLPPFDRLIGELSAGRTQGCPGLEAPLIRRELLRKPPLDLPSLLRCVARVPDEALAEDRADQVCRRAGLDDETTDLLVRVLRGELADGRRAQLRRRLLQGLRAGGTSVTEGARCWDVLVAELPSAQLRTDVLDQVTRGLRGVALRLEEPAAFVAARLATPNSEWPLLLHASEAVRQGLTLRHPCVQEGPVETTGEDSVVLLGLVQVRGVRPELCLEIAASRRLHGPFADLADLLLRVPAADDEVDALIASGALDALAPSRADLRRLHRHLRPHRDRPRSGRRRRSGPPPERVAPPTTDADHQARRAARLRDELRSLGFTVSGHPLQIVDDRLPSGRSDPSGWFDAPRDSDVVAAGWLVSDAPPSAGPPPPEGRWWMTFDTPEASFEAAVPDRLTRDGAVPLAGPCSMAGTLRREGRWTWLDISRIEPLADAWGLARSA